MQIYGGFAALPSFLSGCKSDGSSCYSGRRSPSLTRMSKLMSSNKNADGEPCLQEIAITQNSSFDGPKVLARRKTLHSRQIAHDLEIPIRLVNEILFELVASGLASEVKADEGRGVAYEPARDPDTMTIRMWSRRWSSMGATISRWRRQKSSGNCPRV